VVTAWAKKKSKASETEAAITVVDGVANMEIPEEIFDEAELLWKCFVVGHFIGDAPHIGSIHATVNRIWSSSKAGSKIDVQFIEKNTVLFRIEDSQMRARVLQRKHWHIKDIPLVVNVWSPESAMNPPDLSAMPLWVDLKGVPNNLYSHKGLRCLAKAVGKFVRLHPSTEKCVRLDVARVLVEVDLQQPMVERIAFNDSKGEKREVEVNFPWVPPRCSICCRWGHKGKDCNSKEVMIMKKQTEVKEADVYANEPEPKSPRAIGHEIEDLILDLEALKPGSGAGKPLCVIEPTTKALCSAEAGKWETNYGKKHGAGANGAQNTKSGVEQEEKEGGGIIISPSRFSPLQGIEEDGEDEEYFEVTGKEMEEREIYESMNDGKKGQRVSASNRGKRAATVSFSRQMMGKSLPLSRFHGKLKLLKQPLRDLNRTHYGDLPARTKQAYEEMYIKHEAVTYYQTFLQSQDATTEEITVTELKDILTYRCSSAEAAVLIAPSSIYASGNDVSSLVATAEALHIRVGSLPIRYLGMPLTTKTLT
ncbi:hypothetical protein HID58_044757, partial [Brassica napus]